MTIVVTGVVVAVAASLVLPITARHAGRRLPPAALVPLLTATALTAAACLGFMLCALALAVAARENPLAATGHWSPTILRHLLPVPTALGLTAGIIVGVLAGSAAWRVLTTSRALLHAEHLARNLPPQGSTVIDDEIPDAYTLAGIQGRIVITTAMLRALRPEEQRVLYAHEHSHLRHRHHLYLQLTRIAATANPLLRPLVAIVRHGIERWADEDAVRAVGNRRTVAAAIARAGLARARAQRTNAATPRLALGGADHGTADRVAALLATPSQPHPRIAFAMMGLLLVALLTSLATTALTVHTTFERAEQHTLISTH
ncbi:M48 family metalloprotease [Gandjariella thermophila]|uniref:Membrane protein n=1 Tax=Gandjariella thermophila TaxID=1931992 RepID=A0A4D4JAU7_9PSEU|nr:M48 family metalloprotease [Gandjariella thermophila]GDY33945.1 membrane protein [Gandjariella thermophila]